MANKQHKDLTGTDLHIMTDSGYVNPTNLIDNGNFESWSSGATSAPNAWLLGGTSAAVAREGTIIKIGTYSANITRSGTNCYLYQRVDVEKGIEYFKLRTFTFGCWVYATVASRAVISIAEGGSGLTTLSSYHTGDSTWQWLSVTHAVGATATNLVIYLFVKNGDTSVCFDGAMFTEGDSIFAFANKPLVTGAQIISDADETKFSNKLPVSINGVTYYIMLTQT